MPNLNVPEHEADLAEAKLHGAKAVADLIAALTEVGLGIDALSGAIQGHLIGLGKEAGEARRKANDSRSDKPVSERDGDASGL